MPQRVDETSQGRTLRLTGVGQRMPAVPEDPAPMGAVRRRPSAERGRFERERRHRERAIAAWLRDLARS